MASNWYFSIKHWSPSIEEWNFLLSCLPSNEQDKIRSFCFRKDQQLALGSCFLQRALIASTFSTSFASIAIEKTKENKPYWKPTTKQYPFWNYNVSHHGNMVAIGSNPICLIGVDVMDITEQPKNCTMEEFFQAFQDHFTPEEWLQIRVGEKREQYRRFYWCWSLKEAYIKAIGIGLGFDLKQASFDLTTKQLRLHGDIVTTWKFEVHEFQDHVFTIAKGPPDAMHSIMAPSPLTRDSELVQKELRQACPEWVEKGMEELIPLEYRNQYYEIRAKNI